MQRRKLKTCYKSSEFIFSFSFTPGASNMVCKSAHSRKYRKAGSPRNFRDMKWQRTFGKHMCQCNKLIFWKFSQGQRLTEVQPRSRKISKYKWPVPLTCVTIKKWNLINIFKICISKGKIVIYYNCNCNCNNFVLLWIQIRTTETSFSWIYHKQIAENVGPNYFLWYRNSSLKQCGLMAFSQWHSNV